VHSFNMCQCIVSVLIIIIRARESERREPLVQPFVIKLSTDNLIMSGEIKLTRAIKWKSREQILAAICTNIQFIASDKTLLQ